MKPAETGCLLSDHGERLPADAMLLQKTSGTRTPLENICPYRFRDPLAPALAAEREGRTIEISKIEECLRGIEADHDITLVEGAGGLLVPLVGRLTFADLALRFGWPLIVVVGSKLGALNHAFLTIRYAQSIGLKIQGYVVNFPLPGDDLAAETNLKVLRDWLGEPIGILRHGRNSMENGEWRVEK